MYRVVFTHTAQKNFIKLPPRHQRQASIVIEKLSQDPTIGSPLKGRLKGYWKLRFSSYRIIYTFKKQRLTIIIFDIRHRKDIYR